MNHFLLLLIIVLFSHGCSNRPVKKMPAPDPSAPAQALLRSGKTLEAAEFYQQLAVQASPKQDYYRLQAAQIFLQSGNSLAAQTQLQAINPATLSALQRNHYYLFTAQSSLSLGDAEHALDYLDLVVLKQLNNTDKQTYHQSRAFAYSLTGQLLKSNRERAKLGNYISDPQRVYDNNLAIYESLSSLSDSTLISDQPRPPDILGGWMALTFILKTNSRNQEALQSELNRWQHIYSEHPANSAFLTQYLEQHQQGFNQPKRIAVFLPETGPYTRAAIAVHAGIEAAHTYDSRTVKPELQFYDSESADLLTLYQQAQTEGAELIIGPLHKKNITSLINSMDATNGLKIPVLALNHIPDLQKNNLYQFGLSPIDETFQVTTLASSEGHTKALILVPDSALGQRLNDYYTTFWQENQGIVLETQFYNAKDNDFSKPIKQLVNIDESEIRYQRLRRLIPGIKFSPRIRADADTLLLSGSPKTLRQLNPQLHFYRANGIPAYATAQVYGNKAQPKKDIDLNGITFCDMPWVLDENYLGELSINTLRQDGLHISSAYLKLVALGIDAYNVLMHFNQLTAETYAGATGILTLTLDNRIKRQLPCAKFIKGYAQPLAAINAPTSSEKPVVSDRPVNNPFHVQ